MNNSDQDTLDPEMVSLLRAELVPASAEVKERVSNRLAQSVGALALSRATGAPQIPVASSPAPLLAALRAHSLGFAATFVLGTAFGSGLYAATRRAEPMQIVYVERPLAQAPTPAPRAALAPPRPEIAARPEPAPVPTAVSMPSASAERVGSASLAEQQALLDIARRDFARSDYAATLEALSAHLHRYRKSVLGEERDALEIKALAASGRDAEALAHATRFKAQFPQSLLLPSVQDSVGKIP